MGGRARRTGRRLLDLEESKYKSYERDPRPYNPEEKVGWLDDEEGKRRYVVMLGRELWIGRNSACDLVIAEPHISLYHLKLCAVRTSTSQVVVSVQDVSKAGYIINGVARIPQTPLKLRNTTISTRTAVLCSGDVLELPEVNMKLRFYQRRTHTFSAWPVDLQCNTPSLFRTADPASSVTVAPWIVKNYPLGHGTFGQVYLASQTTAPAVQVACKTVDLQVSAKHSTDVQREIEILEALNHPNICGILDTTYGAQQEAQSTIVHLFMPLVLGGDLFSYMEKHRSLTEDEVRFAAKQLIEGTAYLHKMQVAHRDIKPENILLRCSSAYPHLLLADFGLAVSFSDVLASVPASKVLHVTRTYGTSGTEPYMPPEQLGGVLGRNKGIQGWGESIHGREEWRQAVAGKWFGDEMAWDKWSLGVVLFQLIAGCHPYDQTADMDAPGEEMEEELAAAERRKQTAAQSWKSFRASKGQGVLKVGQTDRDQVRSTMYDAAWSFASSASGTWFPAQIWAAITDQGKSFIQALTDSAPHKRTALSTLARHAWFEPVKAELDEMYERVVRQGRLGGGCGSQRPGLGGILVPGASNKTQPQAVKPAADRPAGKRRRPSLPSSDDETAVEVLVESSSPEEKKSRHHQKQLQETLYSAIPAKPNKRRRVVPDSVPETPDQRAARERDAMSGGEADQSASSDSTAVDQEARSIEAGEQGRGKGKARGKAKAKATPASKKKAMPIEPLAGKGKGKGKGKTAAAKPTSAEADPIDIAPIQETADIFPSASQARASLFIPSRDIFGSQQETVPTLASIIGGGAGKQGTGGTGEPTNAPSSLSSDPDSIKALNSNSHKTLKANRNKVNLAPALPASPAAPVTAGAHQATTAAGTSGMQDTLKTPTTAATTNANKKAAPIAIKSKSRPSKVQVSVESTGMAGMGKGKSAFAPASTLDVDLP